MNKKNTTTKLLSSEYAIIEETGEVKGTTNAQAAIEELQKGKQVFIIKTYQLKVKQQLKIENNG